MIQALRAVGVFLLSHVFYCRTDQTQCFTAGKGLSTFVVGGGVIWFAYSRSRTAASSYATVKNEEVAID